MLKLIIAAVCTLLATQYTTAQTLQPKEIVQQFFHAMYDADTLTMSRLMHPSATLTSTSRKDSKPRIKQNTKTEFLRSVASASRGDLNEQISDIEVIRDGSLASVSMEYSFYYKGDLSHCGINVFTLAEQGSSWLIVGIADSRRLSHCKPYSTVQEVDAMVDAWHLAAANADSAAYFGLMTHDAVFVGTDATEVWSKREFLAFAAPYFAKGKAWTFTKVSRNIYTHDSSQIAWFDELIDTWMGPCRGSGVAVQQDGRWLIQHYVLSVTVDNDDMDQFKQIGKVKAATKE